MGKTSCADARVDNNGLFPIPVPPSVESSPPVDGVSGHDVRKTKIVRGVRVLSIDGDEGCEV